MNLERYEHIQRRNEEQFVRKVYKSVNRYAEETYGRNLKRRSTKPIEIPIYRANNNKSESNHIDFSYLETVTKKESANRSNPKNFATKEVNRG